METAIGITFILLNLSLLFYAYRVLNSIDDYITYKYDKRLKNIEHRLKKEK